MLNYNQVNMQAWLFDLDGTLVDTADELAHAFNATFRQYQLPTHPIATLRSLITEGTNVILRRLTGITDLEHIQAMRACVFDHYQAHLGKQSQLFPGMTMILDTLDQQGLPWGIVTNKLQRFVQPLLNELQLDTRAKCVVCGDSLSYRKPHPAPLLHASDSLNVPATQCVYIGDSRTDIQAAKAAAMQAIAVSYGYRCENDDITHWGADWIIDEAPQLLTWIKQVNE